MRRGVYPGSFDPPTIAHLSVARAAMDQRRLDRLDLVISRTALGKSRPEHPSLDDRVSVVRASVAHLSGVGVVVTDAQLLSEIASGYDVVVMGADKWHQIHLVEFYGHSEEARDAALASLPAVAVAPRPPFVVPVDLALRVDRALHQVSSTRARGGDVAAMTPAARAFADRMGGWGVPGPPAVRRSSRPER